MKKAVLYGLGMWVAGTLAIRIAGARALPTGAPLRTAALYLGSFALMAWAMPRICQGIGIEPSRWFEATTLAMLPTLLLDAWACLFFTKLYPNLDPAAAGIFGGWMLMFCAGAVAGIWWGQRKEGISTTR